jgi:hypothetical protein
MGNNVAHRLVPTVQCYPSLILSWKPCLTCTIHIPFSPVTLLWNLFPARWRECLLPRLLVSLKSIPSHHYQGPVFLLKCTFSRHSLHPTRFLLQNFLAVMPISLDSILSQAKTLETLIHLCDCGLLLDRLTWALHLASSSQICKAYFLWFPKH